MCDTLCLIGSDRTLFAKNSDRPVAETHVVEGYGPRPAGGEVRTQYLSLPDEGAVRLVGSRPGWLWGFEHGINEHRVAIGNEKVWTVDDPHAAPPALLGMDLVRLGLERARDADQALDVVTTLLERHGQGGSGEESGTEPYWSSFLIADPRSAWILETSGTTWVAAPVEGGGAISNRVSIGTEWTRSSVGVEAGADFQRWRDPAAPVEIADLRLATTKPCAARAGRDVTPSDLVSVLRDHGGHAWGAVGAVRSVFGPLEAELWAEADEVAARDDPDRCAAFGDDAGRRLLDALDRVDRPASVR